MGWAPQGTGGCRDGGWEGGRARLNEWRWQPEAGPCAGPDTNSTLTHCVTLGKALPLPGPRLARLLSGISDL